MKKIIISVLIVMFDISAICQQNEFKQQFAKQDYRQENSRYKKTAWHLAGGGAALVMVGLAIHDYEYNDYAFNFSGKTASNELMVYAAVCIPASVVLFIVSAKNNDYAGVKRMKFNLQPERAVRIQNASNGYNYYPALSFKIYF